MSTRRDPALTPTLTPTLWAARGRQGQSVASAGRFWRRFEQKKLAVEGPALTNKTSEKHRQSDGCRPLLRIG